MKEKKRKKKQTIYQIVIVGHSFALLPNIKCTIYLFQTTLEGIQYNSYFWYFFKKKRWNTTLVLNLYVLGQCVIYLVFQRRDFPSSV